MRKLLIYILLVCASSLMANTIAWEKDFKSGVENASKQNKPILFISSRHSCKYCVLLEETTFKSATVIEKLNKEFVSIITYSDDNDYMPKELWRPGTPAIWFLLPDGQPMYEPLLGAVDEANFLKALGIIKAEFDKSLEK